MSAEILVRINRRRCVLLGIAQAAMCLLIIAMLVFPLFIGIFDWLILLGLAGSAMFGWFALYFFGLARKNPIALRMDKQGISGFYADPASWAEIKSAFAYVGHKHHRFLGFELHDPVAFRDRQSPWRRYLSWGNGRHHNAHLVVPQIVLADTTVNELAEQAQQFLAAQQT